MSTADPFADETKPKRPSNTKDATELSTQPTDPMSQPSEPTPVPSKQNRTTLATASSNPTDQKSSVVMTQDEFKAAFKALKAINADFMKNLYNRYFNDMDPFRELTVAESKALGRKIVCALYHCYKGTSVELPKFPNEENEDYKEFIKKNRLTHSNERIQLQSSVHMMNQDGKEVPNVRLKGTLFNVGSAIVVIDIAGPANNGFIYLTPVQATYVECMLYNIRSAVTRREVVKPPATSGKNPRRWGKPKNWTSAKGTTNYIADMASVKAKITKLREADVKAGNTPKTMAEYLETFAATREKPQFPSWKVLDPKKPGQMKPGRWLRIKIRPNPGFKLQITDADPILLKDAEGTLFLGSAVAMLVPHVGITAGSPFDMKPRQGQVATVNQLKGISLVGYLSGLAKVYSLSSAVKVKLDGEESFF